MAKKKQDMPKIKLEGNKILNLLYFNNLNALNKLRLIIGLIFLLMTLSIILVLVTVSWIPIVLILISYLLVLVLTIKLFLIKKL
jgi:hypothetical protein